MKFEKPPEQEENQEEKEGEVIKGKELKGKVMAGIGTADIGIYKKYLAEARIKCEIYRYKEKPHLALLVFKDSASQRRVFDELVAKSKKIEGGFWSDSTVSDETKLERLE